MKKNSLFFIICTILISLIIMVSFAGCKGSTEDADDTSSNASAIENDDASDAKENTEVEENGNSNTPTNTNSNSSTVNNPKPNNTTSKGNTVIQDGNDVVIDFGEDEEIEVNASKPSTNNTTSNKTSSAASKNETTTTTSNDGWTGDYIIK